MEIKTYVKEGHLIIENFFLTEKIKLEAIDNILIFHHGERYENRIYFYLLEPIIYENQKKTFWSKLLFNIFLFFNNEHLIIEQRYHNKDLSKILNVLDDNLKEINIPILEGSMYWKTRDNGYEIPMVKLVYSKKGLGLANVLKKYKKIINENEL